MGTTAGFSLLLLLAVTPAAHNTGGSGVGGHIQRRTLPAELAHGAPAVAAAAVRAAAGSSAAPPPPAPECPKDIVAKIASAGHLSVAWTGAVGTLPALPKNAPPPPPHTPHTQPHDDAPGVQMAVQLSKICGGPVVYFPGDVVYNFYSTVNITSQAVRLQGGEGRIRPGVGSVQGLMSASATFIQASSVAGGGPAFFLNSSESMIELDNFAIEAAYTGIQIWDCQRRPAPPDPPSLTALTAD